MLKLSRHKNRKGFSLVEVLLAAAIIGLLCAMAIPNFSKIRANVYKDQCTTNLRRIVSAKEHWSLETGNTIEPSPTQLDPYIKDGTFSLFCPLDSTKSFTNSYNINNVATNPTCKISPSTHKLD